MKDIVLGNLLTESTTYNPRLQPTKIQLGSLLTLDYGFNVANNNGDVTSQTIASPGVGTRTQIYGYDGTNRLSTSSETGSGSWTENFGYDMRGNRWVVFPTTTGLTLSSETPQSATAQSSDWFGTDNRVVPGHGWTYDGAGNVTAIGGMPRSFTYDAESLQISATVNGTVTSYTYDGDGRRVMKTVSGVATVYVYDALGQLAAENGPASSGPGPSYLTADHLGSTRLVTNSSGVAQKCYGYLPFGEEIGNGTAGRSGCYGSSSYPTNTPDVVNDKFTGKKRDAETGLDFFQVRYFSGPQGRFNSPDEPFAGQSPSNPQSWNLYAYALNNP